VSVFSLGMGTVVREILCIGTVEFKISSRFQILKSLTEKSIFIGNACLKLTNMDEVRFCLINPRCLEVINLKRAVRRDPSFGQYGRKSLVG
jgi:hypothetical protein